MRHLTFSAQIKVLLEEASLMTPEDLAEEISRELAMSADIPQAVGVVDYAIQDIIVSYVGESAPVPDEENGD